MPRCRSGGLCRSVLVHPESQAEVACRSAAEAVARSTNDSAARVRERAAQAEAAQ